MVSVELAYSKPTSRMRYGAKILFEVCLGLKCTWVNGTKDESVVISYGDKSVTAPLHSISFSQDKQALSSGVKFPCEVLGVCDLDYDPFASAVFMAARWEEVYREAELEKDDHNRFVGVECSKPVVELLAVDLANMLGIPLDSSRYSYQPTIDVDIAYAFKGRGFFRTMLASLKDLVLLKWRRLVLRRNVLSGKEKDPYDTYSWLEKLHDKHGLKSLAFIWSATILRPYDVGLSSKSIRKLIKSLANWKVRWHPSYMAFDRLNLDDLIWFDSEKERFPGNTSEIRSHYLRCDSRHWFQLDEVGVLADYSLGYADVPGFRSGMCRPYPAFDALRDRELTLMLHPVVVMDSTLKSYMGLTPQQGVELVRELNKEVRSVGGQMITLFHNTSVSDFEDWKDWREAYEEIVDLCSNPESEWR